MVADELSSEALHGDALFEGFGGEGGVEAEEFIALFGDGGPVNLVRFCLTFRKHCLYWYNAFSPHS